jgi:hypothetical protein
MASTYSTNLKLELMGTGDQSGTWGDTTNSNLGTLLEQAIVGYASQAVTDGADTTLTIANGASSTGRNYVINLTGALTAARNVLVPAILKPYIFVNSTTGGFAVTVKVSGQTGVTIANGKKAIVYTNGTDVIEVANAPVTEAGTQTLTNKTLTAPALTGTVTSSGDISMSGTGQLKLPASTTANRSGSPTSGMIRFNSDNIAFEGYNGTAWGNIGGGAAGGGTDQIFINVGSVITTSYTIPSSSATFTGSITTTTLTTSGVTGTITPGMLLSGGTVAANTYIASQLSGTTGGAGTYSVTVSQSATCTTSSTFSNSGTFGPVIILPAATVTVPSGGTWTIV